MSEILKFVLKKGITIVFLIIYIFYYSFSEFLASYDNSVDKLVSKLFFNLFPILIILLIWIKKNRKYIFIFTIVFTLISSIRISYYKNYSMKVESLKHLHNKYGFSVSDMDVIDTTSSSLGFGGGGTSRSARIAYKEEKIYVYYNDGWKDNYQVKKDYNKKNNDNIDELKFLLESFPIEFEVINDPYLGENFESSYSIEDEEYKERYGYIIYIHSSNEIVVNNIINRLNNYIEENDKCNIIYGLYITKEKEIYNKLISNNLSKIKHFSGQMYESEFFEQNRNNC